MCYFKPGCEGVPMFPGGMCAECDARMERRVGTIPYRVRCILDESMRRYDATDARQQAASMRVAAKGGPT